MKRMLNKLTRTMDNAMDRLQRRFRGSRPGSVLIMVVALLVLLALMGTAYLATARQDRLAAGLIRDNGIDAAAKHAAQDALASAGAWLGGQNQTFTTDSIKNPLAHAQDVKSGPGLSNGLTGPLVASRV